MCSSDLKTYLRKPKGKEMNKTFIGLLLAILLLGTTVSADAAIMNIATSGVATQSSTGIFTSGTGYASNAIDGDTNGVWAYNSTSADGQTISHTSSEPQAWWQVDLGQVYKIEELIFWNRTDHGLQYRLDHFDITIFNTAANTIVWSSFDNSSFTSSFNVGQIGRAHV